MDGWMLKYGESYYGETGKNLRVILKTELTGHSNQLGVMVRESFLVRRTTNQDRRSRRGDKVGNSMRR